MRARQSAVMSSSVLPLVSGTSFHTKIALPNTTLSVLFADSTAHWDIEPEESDYPDKWPSGYDFPDTWQDQYSSADITEAQKRERWEDEIWKYHQL